MKKRILRTAFLMSRDALLGLLVCCLFSHLGMAEDSSAQSIEEVFVEISAKNNSVGDILGDVENATSFSFLYSKHRIEAMPHRISLTSEKRSVADVLRVISRETGLLFRQINNTITVKTDDIRPVQRSETSDETIIGTVYDAATNETLPGVNILVKGTTTGTSTDEDGNFELDVSSLQDTLVVTYIGYQRHEVSINGRTEIDVEMQSEAVSGEEVVVVGYGTQDKQNLTSSVDEIGGDELARRPNRDLSESLQGKLPGVNITKTSGNPGTTPDINIRGFTSINGGQPLVLIDGVEGDLNDINPEDVESISVLKDAAASSIYGGRAAFGVVQVTTKDPSTDRLDISYGTNFSMIGPTNNTDFITDGYRAIQLIDNSFRASTGNSYSNYSEEDYEELQRRSEDPSLPSVVVQNRTGQDQYVHYASTDWWNTLFQNRRPTQTHNFSISGGSERLQGILSGRYYHMDGIIKPQDDYYKSYNVRGKLDFKVTEWLELSNNLQVNQEKQLTFGGHRNEWKHKFDQALWNHMVPFYAPRNPDGSLIFRSEINNYNMNGGGLSSALLYGKGRKTDTDQKLRNTIEAVAMPLPTLSVTANYTYRVNLSKGMQRNTRVPWSIYPGQTEYFGTDHLLENRANDTYQAFNAFMNYQKQWEDHEFEATVGINQEGATYDDISASGRNSLSVNLNSLNLASDDPQTDGYASDWALVGYFSRINYNYDGRYLVEVSGRYDGTSRFPANHRWGFFPSASVGWDISNEPFFENLSGSINQLKLRASYGSLGNQQVGAYAYTPTLSKATSEYLANGTRLEYVNPPGSTPHNITWEKVNTMNAGLDIALLQDKITATFDVFQRRTLGMLTEGPTLPAVLGTGEPEENAANLQTRGFELELGYQDRFQLANKPFNFSITGALSNQKSVIAKFNNPNNHLVDFYEGQTIGEIWGYHVDGLFETDEEAANHADQTLVTNRTLDSPGEFGQIMAGDVKYVDLNGDGEISPGENTLNNPGDRRIIGNAAPQFPYSFTLETDWNNIDLSFFLQGVAKQDWYPGNDSRGFWAMYGRGYASFIRKDLANNIWSEDNPDAYFPRLRSYIARRGNSQLSTVNDRYLQNIAYLRLKNITIGYSLPQRWMQRLNIRNIRIYASGENLLTFSPLTDYLDPEAASNGVSLNSPQASFSNSNNHSTAQVYPFNKTYSLGINIDF